MEKGEMEEIKRHFGVVAEGLRSEIQQVAEGVANLDEKLDREIGALRHEMKTEFAEVKSRLTPYASRLTVFKSCAASRAF